MTTTLAVALIVSFHVCPESTSETRENGGPRRLEAEVPLPVSR
jgi:hypothetical protein